MKISKSVSNKSCDKICRAEHLQPVSFLISSISSSLSNVEALDPIVTNYRQTTPSGLSQPPAVTKSLSSAPTVKLANKLTLRAKPLHSGSVRCAVGRKPIIMNCVRVPLGDVALTTVRSVTVDSAP